MKIKKPRLARRVYDLYGKGIDFTEEFSEGILVLLEGHENKWAKEVQEMFPEIPLEESDLHVKGIQRVFKKHLLQKQMNAAMALQEEHSDIAFDQQIRDAFTEMLSQHNYNYAKNIKERL